MAYLERDVEVYDVDCPSEFEENRSRFAWLARKFKGGLKAEHQSKFIHDPRLDAVAWSYAHTFGDQETTPAWSLLEWAMWKLGVTGELWDRDVMWWQGDYAPKGLSKELEKRAGDLKVEGQRYAFGVARSEVRSGKYGQSLVIVEQPVIVDSIPKRFEPGDMILLRGRVLVPHEEATFHMTLGGPNQLQLQLNTENDGKFLVKVPVPEQPGAHMIQLKIWREPWWHDTAFEMPIYVGVEEPAEPAPVISAPPKNPRDIERWSVRVLEAINEERAQYHIPPLQTVEEVTALAQERAAVNARKPYKNYQALDRILRERLGIRTNRWSRLRRRFEFVEELLFRLFRTPYSRGRLLDARNTRIGLGFELSQCCTTKNYEGMFLIYEPRPKRVAFSVDVARSLAKRVDSYGNPASRAMFFEEGADTAELAAAIEQQVAAETDGRVTHEPALDVIAQTYALRGSVERRIRPWLLRKLGLTGDLLRLRRRLVREGQVSSHVLTEIVQLANFDEDYEKLHYGFGLARVPWVEGWFLETEVMMSKQVLLEPLRKRYQPGEKVVVEGRFLGDTRKPRLYMIDADGGAMEMKLDVGSDGYFLAQVVAPEKPGSYTVELAVHPMRIEDRKVRFYTHTVFEAPIYVGIEEPTALDPMLAAPPDNPEDLDKWTERIIELLNAAREERGLAPLQEDRLASALIADRQYQESVTFEYPEFAEIAENLERSGSGIATLGMVRGIDSIDEVVNRDLSQPSFRGELLDEDVTRYGIGLEEDGNYFMLILLADSANDSDKPPSKFLAATGKQRPTPRTGTLTEEQVDEVIDSRLKKLRKCYEEEGLPYDDEIGGKIAIDYVIGVGGKVIAAHLASSQLDLFMLERCFVDVIRESAFPRPLGDGVVFTSQTFKLKPLKKNKGSVKAL
jgi:uncharacterized protein YkwD